MNPVIHQIETPPGLTPPRLLAGDWEGKVLYVESQYLELRRTKMMGVGSRISYSGTEPIRWFLLLFADILNLLEDVNEFQYEVSRGYIIEFPYNKKSFTPAPPPVSSHGGMAWWTLNMMNHVVHKFKDNIMEFQKR